MKRLGVAVLVVVVALLASAPASYAITTGYARHQIRLLIERDYYVNRGPYIHNCRGSYRYIKCDVEFRAGLYWRCGYGSVKVKGGYSYTRLRAPVGC